MTEKTKPPFDKRFQIISGGRGSKLQEPLIERLPAIAPKIEAKIPEIDREKLEYVRALLKKAKEDREIKQSFSCLFTGTVENHEVPTEAAIESFRMALEIMENEFGGSRNPFTLFAVYDTLCAATPEKILSGLCFQRVDFERITLMHDRLIRSTTFELVELYRKRLFKERTSDPSGPKIKVTSIDW